jgi:hypothetical protein
MLGGKIHDAFGSYHSAFTISAVMLLIGALLAFILKAPKTAPAPQPAAPAGDAKEAARREVAIK